MKISELRRELANVRHAAGRPPRHPAETFQTQAWYCSVCDQTNIHLPTELERRFEPEHFRANPDGKIISARNWDKYKDGSRTPRSTLRKNGAPNLVSRVGLRFPKTLWVFEHPLWTALRYPKPSLEMVQPFLAHIDQGVRRYYADLTKFQPYLEWDQLAEDFMAHVADKIWIEIGDFEAAIDHLAVIVLLLRIRSLDVSGFAAEISRNYVKTIGPIAQSPIFNPFYEQFFDWLERDVWDGRFDFYDAHLDTHISSWRRTKEHWILLET